MLWGSGFFLNIFVEMFVLHMRRYARDMTCNINTGNFVQILFGQVDGGGEGLLQLSGTVPVGTWVPLAYFWELNH
jgi:hypothetical protein